MLREDPFFAASLADDREPQRLLKRTPFVRGATYDPHPAMGGTDTTFAIVAVSATAVVGLLGPVIAGLFGRAHQKRELEHQAVQLTRESRRRILREAVERLSAMQSHIIVAKVADQDGVPGLRLDEQNIQETVIAVATQRDVIGMWFGSRSELAAVYRAWEQALLEAFKKRLADRDKPLLGAFDEETRAKVHEARRQFLTAAKPFLDAD